MRCVRTGRQCPGYLKEKPDKLPGIKIYNLPFKVPGSRVHRELLHFYCCEAARGLSRFSDPTLWTELLPQRSQHQPVIRHALAALSFLYHDYIRQGSTPLGEDPTHLQVIVKSHRQLRAYLLSSRGVARTGVNMQPYILYTRVSGRKCAAGYLASQSGLDALKTVSDRVPGYRRWIGLNLYALGCRLRTTGHPSLRL
ncbi:uncharacterized protein EURHEDRAFT_231293 [Aspergillus ruber CBS 135680]|uniref:Uncharacterized protein n=1 Tax=Aspergillus ruber (strain CBS 135680) TaxID=1388766 RepID=A0A017S688_ASPRC|nr:uncharacterized protein EURHEDRAFT_231293 [Aspergillus ruber CBS 135680]EYE91670.1 hypothetical protein EURHEDRAFT_231293 [Aspergillus ruber CBS 135680]